MNILHRFRKANTATALRLAVPVLLIASSEASAYVGPGLGAGTLGVVLGLVGSIFLALFAFFWYPIKRALFGKKPEAGQEEEYDDASDQPLAKEAATKTEDA